MFSSELRELNDAELLTKFLDFKEELFNMRFQNATGSLDKHKMIPALKKSIARVETEMRARELASPKNDNAKEVQGNK